MITVTALSKIYRMGDNQVHALDDVSLTVKEGEIVAIMGPSGSGKSTLMNILGCLDQPTQGSYLLSGRDVGKLGEREQAALRNREIGFVFQSFNLLPKLTAIENVELPLVYAGISHKERRRRANEALERMGLAERIHHKPQELSGGQQQRVAIARALVSRPRFILADEPTGNLDSRSGAEIMGVFQELNRQGITIILVTHEEDIASYTRRIIRFLDGRIISDEPIRQRVLAEEDCL